MESKFALPPARDKTLFTPGPLTTSLSVKQAMLHDAGSWHFEFNHLVHSIREQKLQSCIITSIHFPSDPKFSFSDFYHRLSEKGFIIYPGKISQADTFRIGTIGRIFESDIRLLLSALAVTIEEMGLSLV